MNTSLKLFVKAQIIRYDQNKLDERFTYGNRILKTLASEKPGASICKSRKYPKGV